MNRIPPLVLVLFVAVALAAALYKADCSPKPGAAAGRQPFALQASAQQRLTVIEGTLYLAEGRGRSPLVAVPAGASVTMPKGARYRALAKDPVVLHLAPTRSWDIAALYPDTFPRKRRAE